MSWLDRLRPALNFLKKRDVPDNLWQKCRNCGQLVFQKEFVDNLSVCPQCGHHERISPQERFAQIFDDGRHDILPVPPVVEDPLKFRDQKRYVDRLKAARATTGRDEAMEVAFGTLGGIKAVLAVQNFAFMAGSMGLKVGEAFVAGVNAAVARKVPYIVFTAAGGARMQEGTLSLMQMPRTTAAIAGLRDAGLPYIVVLTDPTTGGVTASYAMLGDIQIAEPGALIGFAGRRVIENTIREKLPDGFQSAEYLLEHGMIDMVTPRAQLRDTLIRILSIIQRKKAT